MKSKLTDVRALMDDSVYKDEMFTDKHKRQVLNRISKKVPSRSWVPRSLSVVFSLILIVSVAYLLNTVLNETPVQQGNPDGAEQPPTPPQEPSESPVPAVPEEEENDETPDEAAVNEKAEDSKFELTPEELAAYENFSADFDTAHLKDLDPISVAKLYVWAGYNQNSEMQYELYTDREESIMWDKEYHMAIPENDTASPEETLAIFNNIEEGEFIQSDEYYGYIRYYPTEDKNHEATSGFVLLQNEDGVWQVGFMPLQ